MMERSITDQVKTFEDACAVLELDPIKAIPDFSGIANEKNRKALIAHSKLLIIIEALNEGWEPDWDNADEIKYQPYFKMKDGFSYYHYGDWSITVVSSRLVFKNYELMMYAVTQFLSEYKDYYSN